GGLRSAGTSAGGLRSAGTSAGGLHPPQGSGGRVPSAGRRSRSWKRFAVPAPAASSMLSPMSASPTADEYGTVTAKYYDHTYAALRGPTGDAEFYRRLARECGGPVLELGCGTGRVLGPIAQDGLPCVGLDASPAML